jgi:hypothetical protein
MRTPKAFPSIENISAIVTFLNSIAGILACGVAGICADTSASKSKVVSMVTPLGGRHSDGVVGI